MISKNSFNRMAAMLFLLSLSHSHLTASELLIPLPGQKQIDKASATTKIEPAKQSNKRPHRQDSGALIPLPRQIKPKPAQQKKPEEPVNVKDKPLIKLVKPEPDTAGNTDGSFPTPADEIVITSNDMLGDLLDEATPTEVTVSDAPAGGQAMPIFPKDTSSAIFMVMKTWICEGMDGNDLLRNAVEAYSNEADDPFKIVGLEDSAPFSVNLDEEDITLDELLDILASRTGRDWGADVPSKTIYFYPIGVKTDSHNVW